MEAVLSSVATYTELAPSGCRPRSSRNRVICLGGCDSMRQRCQGLPTAQCDFDRDPARAYKDCCLPSSGRRCGRMGVSCNLAAVRKTHDAKPACKGPVSSTLCAVFRRDARYFARKKVSDVCTACEWSAVDGTSRVDHDESTLSRRI
jgi:hypothetical protein